VPAELSFSVREEEFSVRRVGAVAKKCRSGSAAKTARFTRKDVEGDRERAGRRERRRLRPLSWLHRQIMPRAGSAISR